MVKFEYGYLPYGNIGADVARQTALVLLQNNFFGIKAHLQNDSKAHNRYTFNVGPSFQGLKENDWSVTPMPDCIGTVVRAMHGVFSPLFPTLEPCENFHQGILSLYLEPKLNALVRDGRFDRLADLLRDNPEPLQAPLFEDSYAPWEVSNLTAHVDVTPEIARDPERNYPFYFGQVLGAVLVPAKVGRLFWLLPDGRRVSLVEDFGTTFAQIGGSRRIPHGVDDVLDGWRLSYTGRTVYPLSMAPAGL